MFWNPDAECKPIEDLKKAQYRSLKTLIMRLYEFNDFYRNKMKAAGVRPDDITCLEDISKLPFMTKSDLRDNYPTKMFSIPTKDVVRYHVSSGTTGKPTLVGYNRHDLDYWTESLARAMTSVGITSDDTVQVSYGYGLFTGGLGLHYGAERIGASVLPSSTGNTERQIELMIDLGVTVIACTPSYLIHMGDVAERMGVDFRRDTCLRKALLGAEPWTEGMRAQIENGLGIDAYDIYGTSELAGPMFTECAERNGLHIWGDIAYIEVVDPETHEVLGPGQRGELVITMLNKETFPLVRYMIKDVTAILDEKCACGRTSPRIERISGRTDDMLIIRGINVFPSQIEHVLLMNPSVNGHYQIIVDRVNSLDVMTLQAEINPEAFSDKMEDVVAIKRRIENDMKKYLNVSVKVELKESGSLPRFEGKARRVTDRRKY
ncbi:MAG: phenylacetate--CoA ligase [Thermoplasmatales archaeon]|jgi:phenylacetate-CoA ligase|nr:phenylacetate--CoA ligase [Thermoplasmatales archaeon]